MNQVMLITNPFEPLKNIERFEVKDGITPREWLAEHFGAEFVEFSRPTALQLNGEFLLRAEWETRQLKDGDVSSFVALPQGIELGIAAIIVGIVAISVSIIAMNGNRLTPDPKIPNDTTQTSDSVYTLRGQTNQFRPSEPIEVSYGKVRHWPTYACRPYSEYEGNRQFQYSLFCLGQGSFDIQAIQLDDTPTYAFPEMQIEIVPPGSSVNLVASAVYTSLEVSNIELLAPNEVGFPGMSGPFILNDWDTPIHRISVDISLPQGLYKLDDGGHLDPESVVVIFQRARVDENGNMLEDWQPLFEEFIIRRDNTPQRITLSAQVAEGRYMIRGMRNTIKPGLTWGSTATLADVSKVVWEAAKGYAQSVGSFGNVTMIAMRALATNSLNDESAKSFNVIMTRKLPTWTPDNGWAALTATRNPVWAFCDIFRSAYGAKLSDEFLDMPTLYALFQTFEIRQDCFDWIFDSSVSVWEAAKMPMAVSHTMPIPQGSLITAVRDEPQTLPSGVFNQHNIVKGSLKKTIQMFDFQPFDGLTVEYTDPGTWKTKEVNCVLPGRAGLNLDRVKLPGCTDRDRAYREGMYLQARRELQRKTVVFQTGLEGHVPSYMDLISITHDTLRVGQGGMIMSYNNATKEMTLSEQVNFATDAIVHKLAIRGDDGAIMGAPIVVTRGSAPNKVILETDPPEDLDFSTDRVPPLYAFGVADIWAFMGKVSSIKPMDDSTVEITALNYAPSVYDWNESTTIPVVERPVIRNSNNPIVPSVVITPVPNKADRAFIDWVPVAGSASYIVQVSYDNGDNWNSIGNFMTSPIEIGTTLGTLIARVAPFAFNGNVIYTTSLPYVVGSNITPPTTPEPATVQPLFVGELATVKWNSVNNANGYLVDIYTATVFKRTLTVGSTLRADYSFDDYTTDSGTGREIEFRVKAFNEGGNSDPAIIKISNPVPASAPAALSTGAPVGTNYPATWTYGPEEGDEKEFRVYGSTTTGFTPGPANLIATVTALSATIAAPTRPFYWRVAVVDKWGPEITASAQAVIW